MLSSLDPKTQSFLDALGQIGDRMQRAQRQIATGLRVSSVSDDPDQVSTLLQTRADLESTQVIQQNLGRVKAEVDAGEQGLQAAVSIMERVRTLGSQGVSGTATADGRASIAAEVGSLLEQLGGISRTNVEGRYLFSGDSDQTPPYTIDLSQANPVSAYAGSAATRQVQHPNGTRFSVGRTAQDIFDAPNASQNVFASVTNLRAALLADDQAAISGSLGNVATSLVYLNNQLAYYGTVQNKVADATDFGVNLTLQLQTHIGALQDVDVSQAILEFTQAQTQQQAALQVRAKMPRTTLFDYLG